MPRRSGRARRAPAHLKDYVEVGTPKKRSGPTVKQLRKDLVKYNRSLRPESGQRIKGVHKMNRAKLVSTLFALKPLAADATKQYVRETYPRDSRNNPPWRQKEIAKLETKLAFMSAKFRKHGGVPPGLLEQIYRMDPDHTVSINDLMRDRLFGKKAAFNPTPLSAPPITF